MVFAVDLTAERQEILTCLFHRVILYTLSFSSPLLIYQTFAYGFLYCLFLPRHSFLPFSPLVLIMFQLSSSLILIIVHFIHLTSNIDFSRLKEESLSKYKTHLIDKETSSGIHSSIT